MKKTIFTLLASLVGIASARADLLAYDGFDYPAGTNNVPGMNGGTGWNGPWQTAYGGPATIVAGNLIAGTNSPAGYDDVSLGNAMLFPGHHSPSWRSARWLDCSPTGPFATQGYLDTNNWIGTNGKSLYISFLLQINYAPTNRPFYYEFEFKRADPTQTIDGNLNGDKIAGIGNPAGTGNIELRSPGGYGQILGPAASSGEVELWVMRIDYQINISGVEEDTITIYRDPTSAEESNNVPVYSKVNQGNMSFNAIGLIGGDDLDSCLWDEVRIGTTFADVVGSLPAFVSQPRSQNPMAGDSIDLSAQAVSSLPLNYQWYHGNTLLSGQTGTNLSLSGVQPGDEGGYYLIANNSLGSVTSMVAQVTVRSPNAHYLLAYEPFDYPAGSNNLVGMDGGVGWSSGWLSVGGPAGNVFSESAGGSMVAGTNAPAGYDTHSLGNALFQQNGSRSGRWLDCSSNSTFATYGFLDASNNVGADGKTLYMSFMQRCSGTNAPNEFYELEFKRYGLSDSYRIAGIGNNTSSTNVNFRAPDLVTDQSLGAGDTNVNFYVVRIDYVGGADNVYVYRNPTGTSESDNTPTLVKMGVNDMSMNALTLAAYIAGVDVTGDEIRMGLSWEDVVGTAPLDFIKQPHGQTVYLPTNSLTLSSLAVSSPAQAVSYQWYHDGNPVSGGNNADLPLSNLQPSDGGNYWVVASTASTESTSVVAHLEMNVLRIDQQPLNQAALLGKNLTLTLGASGIPTLNYQWYKDNSPITDATNASYSVASVDTPDAGNYYCVVGNALTNLTSSVAVVSVYAGTSSVLAYEGFDYPAGNALFGEDGGTGWNGWWQTIGGAPGDVVAESATGSMVAGTNAPADYDPRSIGNAVYQEPASRSGRWLDCSPTGPFGTHGYLDALHHIGADGKTLYVSFMEQCFGTNAPAKFYEFEFKRDPDGTQTNLNYLSDPGRIAGIGNDTSTLDVNLRAPNSVNNHSLGLGNTNVNFYVMRIDYKAGNDDVRVYRNPTSDTEPATPTLTALGVADMSFNGISIAAYAYDRSIAVDEIRFATTWDGALGLPVSNLLPAVKVANGWRIRFAGSPGFTYTVQRATDVNGPWTDLTTITVPANGLGEYIDTSAPPLQAFYRTVQQ